MAASHFFVGLGAGVAILAVPVLLFTPGSTVPQRIVEWVEGPSQTVQLPGPSDDAAANRPLSGYKPGDPTPAAEAVPTLQPASKPTPVPTRLPAAVAPNPNAAISESSLRWARTGVIRSGGVPVPVRRVAAVDSADDPPIPDGSPVLVAVGQPLAIDGQEWRAIRALNGIVGWVPATQLAVDGEASPAPIRSAAAAPTPTARPTLPTLTQATIANTDGVGVVLRNSPDEADRSRSGLRDGTVVTVLQRVGDDWVRVQAGNGATGWVPTRYVNAADHG